MGEAVSEASITQRFTPAPVEPGASAVLIDVGPAGTRRTVRALGLAPRHGWDDALAAVGGGFLAPAPDDGPAHFQVILDARGGFEICDSAGVPLPQQGPSLLAGEAHAAEVVVTRLVHLARYHAVLDLENPAPSGLNEGFALQIQLAPEGSRWNDGARVARRTRRVGAGRVFARRIAPGGGR